MPRAHRQYVASRQATINNCKVRPPAVLVFMIARIRPQIAAKTFTLATGKQKLAVMCQKEMQRRAILSRRQGRDANLRAKKMAREVRPAPSANTPFSPKTKQQLLGLPANTHTYV
jgi:hypothetical protein